MFSSIPLYHLDSPNWHQQPNDHQQLHESSTQHAPPNPGGGPMGSIKPNSMADRAHQAKLPQPEGGLKCPRCDSTNTKFCYFNNYSLSQPRHFCKTCRRYWTRGGALRNVPVGGGPRRTAKRSSKSRRSGTSSATPHLPNPLHPPLLAELPVLPSLQYHHHVSNPNPNGIGLNLVGEGGAEVGFYNICGDSSSSSTNLVASFEGLGRINGMNSFENQCLISSHALQPQPLNHMDHADVVARVASVKIEDSRQRRLNLGKGFETGVHQGSDHEHHHRHQYGWSDINVWTSRDLSSFASPSSTSHIL